MIGESTVQTRLICILRGLEVNMHEGIKRYACKQTTRSLWITVPTSEPFIFLLACNQADLVCNGWWFHTNDWTLRDVNLLRKKTLSPEQMENWKIGLCKKFLQNLHQNYYRRRGFWCIFVSLIWLNARRNNWRQKNQNRERMYIWKNCAALDTELWWPIKYWRKCLLELWIHISDRLPPRLSSPMNEYFISENRVALKGTITKS